MSNQFEALLKAAVALPMVRIQREDFLRRELGPHCSEEQLALAVSHTPALAGISIETVDAIAEKQMQYEAAKASALSFAAGIPGGLAMAATVPADLAQYFGHLLRIAQKIAYLYGWQEIAGEDGTLDEGAQSLLTLFVGIMFGVEGATKAVAKISEAAVRSLAGRVTMQTLVTGAFSPVVKKVSAQLGVHVAGKFLTRGVSSLVPILGGMVSGGVTFATFGPMARRLQSELREIAQAYTTSEHAAGRAEPAAPSEYIEPEPGSPEARLNQLAALLLKGLITEEEYAEKRREIIGGL